MIGALVNRTPVDHVLVGAAQAPLLSEMRLGDRIRVACLAVDDGPSLDRCRHVIGRVDHLLVDFAATSDFHLLSPESPFNATPHCTRLTPEGWAMLNGDRLELWSNPARRYALTDPKRRAAVLDWMLHDARRPPL